MNIKTLTVIILAFLIGTGCKKEEENPDVQCADNSFYNETKSDSGYVYYQNGKILPSASPSPHGSFKLRFNSIAQSVLDSTGELPKGATFPENSILVKELYSGTSLKLIVPIKKASGSSYSANGWVWAEYEPNGAVVYSIGKVGDACTGCHSLDDHRDFVKTFDLH